MGEKTYVFSDGNNGGSNSFDPNLLLGMMFGGGGFGGYGGGNWLWPLFLLAFWGNGGWGGFGGNGGFGGRGVGFLSDQLNNDAGRQLLMQAINGNGQAIGNLATQLGCKAGDIQNALHALQTQICQFSNQSGIGQQQIINSLQSGNASLASQIAACCCDLKTSTERGFSSVAYETARQTCDIEKAISASTAQVVEGQRAAEMRELQDKLDALREKNSALTNQLSQEHQTAIFGQMITQATAPLATAISGVQGDIDKIKCKLPQTITVPYSEATAIPNCVAYNYGFGGYPFFNNGGFWG